jgi:hypothetical protein
MCTANPHWRVIMNRTATLISAAAMLLLAGSALAAPINGTYTSTDPGGQVLTSRASTHRTGINSGLPHVLHAQSWDGASLGTQWEIRCAVNNAGFTVQDNRIAGTGTVVYTSSYTGGRFTYFAGGWPWGDGTGTLGNTFLISTVQCVNNIPVASVVNGNTSGVFQGGCALTFAIANGVGVGETTSLNPAITKPADYPVFLDGTCNPAAAGQHYGSWGTVITMTLNIDCATPAKPSSWGSIKTLYR